MPVNYRRHLEEHPVPGKPLGRHVNHDPRSLAYKVVPDGTAKTVRWERETPVLDQGDLGSCTGNAAVGVLGTRPFRETLVATAKLDEDEAVAIYSAATRIDNYAGTYPPTDTGSDGLSVAKACQAAGLISGYTHITSLAAAKTAIQAGPFIVGTDWRSGMDTPDDQGVVKATGSVRGGHEYECIGYDAGLDLWEFVNSWGPSWGKSGHFFYTSATFSTLLKADGDGTVFVPNSQPAPQPNPPAADLKAQVLAKLQELIDWIKTL
jgi:hypothetical protein